MGSLRTRTVDATGRQRREGWLQHCPLSYNQARCIHPPFAECYGIQAGRNDCWEEFGIHQPDKCGTRLFWGEFRRREDVSQGALRPTATWTRTHSIRSVYRPTRPTESSAYAPLCYEEVSICCTSHELDECGSRPFWDGSGCRAVTQHVRQLQTCLGPRRHSPKKGCLRRQVLSLTPPRRVSAWWGLTSEGIPVLVRLTQMPAYRNPCQTASTGSKGSQDTLDQIRVPTNTAHKSVSQSSSSQRVVHMLYSAERKSVFVVHVPQTGRVKHKGFFRWVRAQGRSPTPAASNMPQTPLAFP